MNYLNYGLGTVLRLGVHIVGWIGDIKNPKDIDDEELSWSLREKWRTGECRRETLTPEAWASLKSSLEQREQAGQAVGKARKPQADKGKKRKVDDNEVTTNTPKPARKPRKDKGVSRKLATATDESPATAATNESPTA